MRKLSLIMMALSSLFLVSCGSLQNVSNKLCPEKKVRTTAYTHNERDHLKYKRKDALGNTLKPNYSAAADWSVFPAGTIVKIDNHNYEICDYGSALVTDKWGMPVIDIYQPSKTAMRRWGVRYFDNVKVVKWGDWRESATILQKRQKYWHCRTMYNNILAKL